MGIESITGVYECRVDANGRLLFPADLKRHLAGIVEEGFVIREGMFEPCLELYPLSEWEKEMKVIDKLNPFDPDDRLLIHRFSAGMRVELDGNGRLLIPMDMKRSQTIEKDIILTGCRNKMVIWNKSTYSGFFQDKSKNYGEMLQKRLGNQNKQAIE